MIARGKRGDGSEKEKNLSGQINCRRIPQIILRLTFGR
jgi:hypothetical protein